MKRPERLGVGSWWQRTCLLLLVLALAPGVSWAEVKAALDRDTVFLGDRFMLIIESDVIDQGIEPDLSPLEKDFQVHGTNTGRQTQILNAQRSDTIRWSIQLEPRRAGAISIPAIQVGQIRTEPFIVTVKEPLPQSDNPSAPVFLEVDVQVGEQPPYVQQQIRYTARLYLQQPLISGNLSAPQADNAVVEQLGEQSIYRTTRNGKEVQVIERSYAIFPEISGELRIPPLQFSGRIASPSNARENRSRNRSLLDRFFGENPFGGFAQNDFFAGTPFGDQGVPVSQTSKGVVIPVRPRPSGYAGRYWLPADKLALHDSWEQNLPSLRVGEPVVRRITVEARGLEASQVPSMEFAAPGEVRTYPEQPTTTNSIQDGWVVSRSEQSLAYIPKTAGEITFPEIRLDWWDTRRDSQQTAILPARTILVEASAAATPETTTGTKSQEPKRAGEQTPTPSREMDSSRAGENSALPPRNTWPWVVAVVVLLIASLVWRLTRRRRTAGKEKRKAASRKSNSNATVRKTTQALRNACDDNDAAASANVLLELASFHWPNDPPRNLGSLADRVGHGATLVCELEKALYAENPPPWKGDKLWREFKQGFSGKKEATDAEDELLAPLYPS